MGGGRISSSQGNNCNYYNIKDICSSFRENNDVCSGRKSINLYERFSHVGESHHLSGDQFQDEFLLLTNIHPIDRHDHLDALSKSKKEHDISPEKRSFYKRSLQKVKNVPKAFADLKIACKKYFP